MTRKVFEMKVLVEGDKVKAHGKYAKDVTASELEAILRHLESAEKRTAMKGLVSLLN